MDDDSESITVAGRYSDSDDDIALKAGAGDGGGHNA